MTQHYKDANNNIYGYKPANIEVTPITMEEVHQINEAKTTPEQRKETLLAQAKQDYELGIKNLIGEVPYTEIASWDKQEQEARALLADSTAVTPFIDALVVARNMGETREVLAGKIVANADAYMVGAAQLLGEYQARLKEINGV